MLLMGGRRVLAGHGSSLKGDGRPYCEILAVRHQMCMAFSRMGELAPWEQSSYLRQNTQQTIAR